MISKSIRPFVYVAVSVILSYNDITFKMLTYWLILGLLVIMDISHALD